jgi:hypothetical protein
MEAETAVITNRILKTEPVDWKTLLPIQGEKFKELSKESYLKLKHSLKQNKFVAPFAIWQAPNGKLYTLDGVHRCKVLLDLQNEGVEIPVMLPANFIDAQDRKEAAKLLLVYSSAYARTTDEGLYEFINLEGLDFDELKLEIDISDLDMEKFEAGWMKDVGDKFDFTKLDEENESLEGSQFVKIQMIVPKENEQEIKEWLSNGEGETDRQIGRGVMKRCGLL